MQKPSKPSRDRETAKAMYQPVGGRISLMRETFSVTSLKPSPPVTAGGRSMTGSTVRSSTSLSWAKKVGGWLGRLRVLIGSGLIGLGCGVGDAGLVADACPDVQFLEHLVAAQ